MSGSGKPTGLFIVFEGPEGSGKSTQSGVLARRILGAGFEVVLTREPGGTDLGERVRGLLLRERKLPDVEPRVQALLMLAARAQHIEERIRPSLRQGGVVICDRFAASTLAYQGAGFGLDVDALADINDFATDGIRADLTLLLDINAEVGLARSLNLRGSDWEKAGGVNAQGLDFHERVRQSYLVQAEQQGWATLDAMRSEEELGNEIWQRVETELGKRELLPAASAVQPPLPMQST